MLSGNKANDLKAVFKEFNLRIIKRTSDLDDVKATVHAIVKAVLDKVEFGGITDTLLLILVYCITAMTVGGRETELNFDEMVDGFSIPLRDEGVAPKVTG